MEDDEEKSAIWWHSLTIGETRQMTANGHTPIWPQDVSSILKVTVFHCGMGPMPDIYLLLDEIRQDPQNSQERWGTMMDYFLNKASDTERQELIALVSGIVKLTEAKAKKSQERTD